MMNKFLKHILTDLTEPVILKSSQIREPMSEQTELEVNTNIFLLSYLGEDVLK